MRGRRVKFYRFECFFFVFLITKYLNVLWYDMIWQSSIKVSCSLSDFSSRFQVQPVFRGLRCPRPAPRHRHQVQGYQAVRAPHPPHQPHPSEREHPRHTQEGPVMTCDPRPLTSGRRLRQVWDQRPIHLKMTVMITLIQEKPVDQQSLPTLSPTS